MDQIYEQFMNCFLKKGVGLKVFFEGRGVIFQKIPKKVRED